MDPVCIVDENSERLYVLGGGSARIEFINVVDIQQDHWHILDEKLPQEDLQSFHVVLVDGLMYIIGAATNEMNPISVSPYDKMKKSFQTVYVIDLAAPSVETLLDALPYNVTFPGVIAVENTIYAFGGMGGLFGTQPYEMYDWWMSYKIPMITTTAVPTSSTPSFWDIMWTTPTFGIIGWGICLLLLLIIGYRFYTSRRGLKDAKDSKEERLLNEDSGL